MTEANEFTRFVYILKPKPRKAITKELAKSHVEHLKVLDEKGFLVLCGPFTDQKGGMVILKVKSKEDAIMIAESDPFVKSGTEDYELCTWELSCKENNHMGLG